MYRPYLWSNAILSLYLVLDFAKQPSKTPLTVVNESPLELLWRHIHCYVSVSTSSDFLSWLIYYFLCHKPKFGSFRSTRAFFHTKNTIQRFLNIYSQFIVTDNKKKATSCGNKTKILKCMLIYEQTLIGQIASHRKSVFLRI